jgi:hypothetical protein
MRDECSREVRSGSRETAAAGKDRSATNAVVLRRQQSTAYKTTKAFPDTIWKRFSLCVRASAGQSLLDCRHYRARGVPSAGKRLKFLNPARQIHRKRLQYFHLRHAEICSPGAAVDPVEAWIPVRTADL